MEAVTPRNLSRAERLAWLRLIRTENVGPITFRQLLRRFGSADAALDALPDLARRGGRARPIRICSAAAARCELEALEALDARLIALFEPDYPLALAALDDAPPLICCFGLPHLLQRNAVAVVGARNASANGRRQARQIAAELGSAGLLVVSGMARGIDAAAHEGALDSGTVAVVAGGVDVIYPEENGALYGEIKARGVVLSEMPAGTVPQARHFPRRNRLISGMALGTLVVEAAPHSGSLITARFALDQGREVLAVPGSPLDPRARGCNDLIRQGRVRSIPIHVDSPMAISVTDVYCDYHDLHRLDISRMRGPECVLEGPNVLRHRERAESKALNRIGGPAIIISASGMLTGGRILHHLINRLPDPSTILLTVGYMAEGTLGRKLLNGDREIYIHKRPVEVKAKIASIHGLSGHADYTELGHWLEGMKNPPYTVFITHGEISQSAALAEYLKKERDWRCHIPILNESVRI